MFFVFSNKSFILYREKRVRASLEVHFQTVQYELFIGFYWSS